MTDRIPSGTRDVLPDEMRELRAITEAVRSVFEARGYGEIYTPALEYASTLERAELDYARPAYKLFDERGDTLALRSDMTLPIARVVATRYAGAEPPLRFSYFAHAYRGVRPQRGQPREFLQAGVELVGAPAPDGTAEALGVLCAALDAAGLRDYRVGLGDASVYPALLDSFGVAEEPRGRILHELATRDFVGLSASSSRPTWTARPRRCCCACLRSGAGWTCSRRPRARSPTRCPGCGPCRRCSRPRPPRGSSSTSACRAASATTRGRSSRSTTRRSAPRWAAAGATTTSSGASGARCRPWASASTSSACTSRWPERERAAERTRGRRPGSL